MRATTLSHRLWLVLLCGLCGLALVLDGRLVPDASAQSKSSKKKKKKEEEGDERPKPSAKRKALKREEEEEGDQKPDETRAINLKAEAAKAQGKTQELFTALATPYDTVRLQPDQIHPSGRLDRVQPISRYIAGPFKGELKATRLESGSKRTSLTYDGRRIKQVIPFEQTALTAVQDFLSVRDLPHLQAAEKALIFALRFHSTTRKRDPADAKPWAVVEEKLRSALLDVRREQIPLLARVRPKGRWKEAFALAEQLARDNPGVAEVQLALLGLTFDRAESTGKLQDYLATRQMLLKYEGLFPSSARTESIRKGLLAKAEKLAADATALAEKDRPAAVRKLRQAAQLWPQLASLQEKLRDLDSDSSALYVGVHSLPKYLSPATAYTDSEKQAVELLFEGLVKSTFDSTGDWRFQPALSEGRPRVVYLGREFQLAQDAFWSDGKRVSATDIRHTVSMLKSPSLPGRNTEWAKLVEDPRVEGTPYQIRITLRNGFLDPLALMTFKILPRQVRGKILAQADDEDFALNPVGSGPYQLQGPTTSEGYQYVVFTANPFYQRANRPARPRIREVRFFVSRDPVREFRDGRLHLLLDLPTDRIKALKEGGSKDQNILTLATPRVYFLAANHKQEALQNQHLRKALAHAIDREAILKAHFRAGYQGVDRDGKLTDQAGADTRPLHPALNGPYPPGSWACSPNSRVPAKLYGFDLARSHARRALAKLNSVELTLKYPDDDPRVARACQDISAQVAKLGMRLKITPVALAPREFRKAIFKRDYELAYCHYDYSSEVYWLWPLFNPDKNARDPGGSNFLRYENDSELESLFRKAMNHRDFTEVKKLTHDIHAHLYEKMPLIPLWQLHIHMAVHPNLQLAGLDPLRVFTNAEDWKLQKK